MNSTTAAFGIKKIQDALKVLSMLQMTAFLWPQQANIPDGTCFDYIIVGAGSAGSVIANRLTEIDSVTVLLIEAGGDPPVESVIPSLLPFLKNSDADWQFYTENDNYSQQFHKNYGVELTRGKMLGGSSSINFMVYTRGHAKVYDDWAQIVKDYSWNWENILPYFKKSEKLVDPIIFDSSSWPFHGTDGPMEITKLHRKESIEYLQGFAEAGHNIIMDQNTGQNLGYAENMVTVASGVRQSTAHAFLRPIKKRPNLFVLKNTLVSKILFDENRNAVGVEAILKDNSTVRYMSKLEVIVCAGSISTPQLLMLSGIGPKGHLIDMDIDVIFDLPVGQNLQDHVMVILNTATNNTTPPKPNDPRAYPFPIIMGFATLDGDQDYPDYQSINMLLNDASGVLSFCSFYFSYIDVLCDALHYGSIGKQVLFTFLVHINPESRGQILLRSSDPKDKPLIYTGYYSDPRDLENHAKYIEDYVKVYESEVFRRMGAELVVPEVCGCGNIHDHEYWKCYALCMMVAGYHYAGSCPMGTVVDSRLNVYGVQRLRIADASIMPKMPGGNTNPATIMIGEKAADFIKEDYYFGCF